MYNRHKHSIISSLIGLAYGGNSPFQAEVYFINLAEIIQIKFAVPFFDVYDSKYPYLSVPVAARGTISFKIINYREFIRLHRLDNFTMDNFKEQIHSIVIRYMKDTILNYPEKCDVSVLYLEKHISRISEIAENTIGNRLFDNYGVFVSGLDIESIEIDKTSDDYKKLKMKPRLFSFFKKKR